MNYYKRIWRSKKKASKSRWIFVFLFVWCKIASFLAGVSIAIAIEYFGRLRTIKASLKSGSQPEMENEVFPFSLRHPILRDYNMIILLIFFSSNYSLTVILFLLLFVFHKTEFKYSIYLPLNPSKNVCLSASHFPFRTLSNIFNCW